MLRVTASPARPPRRNPVRDRPGTVPETGDDGRDAAAPPIRDTAGPGGLPDAGGTVDGERGGTPDGPGAGEAGGSGARTRTARHPRSARTREAVVTAMLELIAEGDLRPRGKAIAARADVSLRSLYHHFDDLDELLVEAASRIFSRIDGLRNPVDAAWPLAVRIERFVDLRVRTLEVMVTFWRAALIAADTSEPMQAMLDRGRGWLRAQVEEYFRPELDRLPPEEGMVLFDAVHLAASAAAWDLFRTELGLGAERAGEVMELVLRATLATADR